MLTPQDCTAEGMLEYADSLLERDSSTLTDDQLRVLVLTRIIATLGAKLTKIREALND